MKRPLMIALLALSACGTPQEQCISAGTRDLGVVGRLAAESEANLARGYGYETVTTYQPRWVRCGPMPTQANPNPEPQMCFEQVPVTSRREVAIDPVAEKAKLKGLRAKEAQLSKAAQPLIAQCKAKYPQ